MDTESASSEVPTFFEHVEADYRLLSGKLTEMTNAFQHPDLAKKLRRFTPGEAAKLIGISVGYLRQMSVDGLGPQPDVLPNKRRFYSLHDINEIRRLLDESERGFRRYSPKRQAGEHLQVISVTNFKGGSGKTTTTVHLAQYLALRGYRVLAIDLDPQASLTSLFGVQPELQVGDLETIFGALVLEEPRPIRDVIRQTYFEGVDLIPAAIELQNYEYQSAMDRSGTLFTRMGRALAQVEDDYDIVVMDCPPQLGFLTMSAIVASTAILITVHPQMLDVLSMAQFLRMATEIFQEIERRAGKVRPDWIRYLGTRYEGNDAPQAETYAFIRNLFKGRMLKNQMIKSVAISDAVIRMQTLYERERDSASKQSFDRAMEAMELVNEEIEGLIRNAWGRAS